MSSSSGSEVRAPQALGVWGLSFVAANVASIAVLVATGHANEGVSVPTWVVAASTTAMWAVYLAIIRSRIRATGTPDVLGALGVRATRTDSWGLVLGVACQLVLVNLVNWPLSRMFPEQFNSERVSMRAEDLIKPANGWWMVVLVLVVVVGAPIVEEIVYRGWVHPGLVRSWGPTVGTLATAVLFAAIHFVPVEFPGLLAFALVLGWARQRTGRLGLCVISHMAFNATGLLLVALR